MSERFLLKKSWMNTSSERNLPGAPGIRPSHIRVEGSMYLRGPIPEKKIHAVILHQLQKVVNILSPKYFNIFLALSPETIKETPSAPMKLLI